MIYILDSRNKGLNIWGSETLAFQFKPSCMSIRINDVYIQNMSWDFMCSKKCGCYYPKPIRNDLQPYKISDFRKNNVIRHPILNFKIYNAALHFYQALSSSTVLKKLDDSFVDESAIFFQYVDHVKKINNRHSKISFSPDKCRTPQYRLIAQTYDLQIKSFLCDQKIFLPQFSPKMLKIITNDCKLKSKKFFNLTFEEHKQIWGI